MIEQMHPLDFNVVVPARYASSRLPGKPLMDIGGVPMVLRTVAQASKAGAQRVVVATDNERILDVCRRGQIEAVMTDSSHQSGTDRMCEVVDTCGWDDDQVVINVQGDEPFIPPDSIVQVAELLTSKTAQIATLATPITDDQSLSDPNVVKVVRNTSEMALYFSRAPIPLHRDGGAKSTVDPLRHIGIYGYRSGALRQFAEAGCCELERHEQLEQLRALWHGWPIKVGLARTVPGPGVDTPEDLERARAFVRGEGCA